MYGRLMVSVGALLMLGVWVPDVPANAEQRGAGQQQQRPQTQQPGQQQQRPQTQEPQTQQQRQMAQMQEMVQHMEQVATRAQEMSRNFGDQAEQTQNQAQLRERLRVYQQMCDSIAVSARETRRSLDRIREMQQDQVMAQDREMQRDMEQVREQLQVVGAGLDDALNAMARIQERVRTTSP